MTETATILLMHPPVNNMLTDEEKKVVALISKAIVKKTLKTVYEQNESYQIPAYQYGQAK